jgi:tetratricopeptide (TPR) repeat protein
MPIHVMCRAAPAMIALAAAALPVAAQAVPGRSALDPIAFGIVYDVPGTRNVRVQEDVPYLRGASRTLALDIYTPPRMRRGERLPAVVFLNAVGDGEDTTVERVKRWGIYRSWPRLVAAHGMIGISMDADRADIQGSLRGVFRYLAEHGAGHGVDPARLGVYAASANVGGANELLFGDSIPRGVRAAALYYGGPPDSAVRLRRDLPVLFIVAQGDAPRMGAALTGLWQRVVAERLPWTLEFGADMPHAFDAFTDSDDARRIIQRTIAFWRSHLEPVPPFPPGPPGESEARAIVAALYGNEPAPAAERLARWTAAHPGDAEAFRQYARVLVALQRLPAADSAYARAYQLDSTHAGTLWGLGQMRSAQRRWADAERLFTRAVAGGMEHSMIFGQLGWAQLHLGRHEEAARSYERAFALGIPPGRATRGVAWYNLACAYAKLGRTDQAFAALDSAVAQGVVERRLFETDDDLAALRRDQRFARLIARLPAAPPSGTPD